MTAVATLAPAHRPRFAPHTALVVFGACLALPQDLAVAGLDSPITPARVVAVGCLLWWGVARLVGGLGLRRGSNPVRAATLLMIWVLLVTHAIALASGVVDLKITQSDSRLAAFVVYVGLALLAADGLDRLNAVRAVMGALVIAATLSAFAAVLQYAVSFDLRGLLVFPGLELRDLTPVITERGGLKRSLGFANHPIELAAVSTACVPLALHLAKFASWRMFWLCCAAVLVAGPVVSVSRTGLLGLVLVMLALLPRWGSARWSLMVTTLGGIGVFAMTLTGKLADVWSQVVLDANKDTSVLHRTSVWDYVAEQVTARPLSGQGFGTYTQPAQPYLDNQYLFTAVESGIPGLLAMMVFLAVPLWWAHRVWRIGAHSETIARRERLALSDAGWAIGTALLVCAVSFGTFDALSFPQMRGFIFTLIGVTGALVVLTRGRQS
ncbi:hypothetical protein GCM10012275_33700 [Longimycelium tulufanense]|uniref:O-antigen ligase-related domain-containing protein n=1 Tax=Longimycelium tulufanense TaxID=907463 RepID=A0A8J3CFQ0_9PSEU|nr:O-antigen ligase family protein [Longimycelium tulufanense]GGM59846.1 hypothetical protein GCM10012275_33700 [Longimycelium tulufanense]